MNKKLMIVAMISTTLLAASCDEKKQPDSTLTSGIYIENLDTTVSPQQDFYQYACGGWINAHPLTKEHARYGSFDKLREDNLNQLHDMMSEIASTQHKNGSVAEKIAIFYNLGMDTATINKQGAMPIQKELQSIYDIKQISELSTKLSRLALDGTMPLIGVFGEANPNDSKQTIAWVWQTGLGIGDRDYYLEDNMQDKRDAYVVLLTQMIKLSGYNKIAGIEGNEEMAAKQILAFETQLAKAFMDKNTLRDPFKTSNIMSVTEWQKLIPVINVTEYLTGLGLSHVKEVNVGQVDYQKELNNILSNTDLDIVKNYLATRVTLSAAPYLSKEFVDANFEFYGKTLSGSEEQRPLWKRVVSTVDGALGEAVGQMYVEKYFPASAKERMIKLVDNLEEALRERIKQNTWMSDETKEKSYEKLGTFIVKVGYPDTWRSYNGLKIEKDSYYANIERASRFEMAYLLAKIGKPVDPQEWLMTPQTVNAYYNPTTNEICFPAAILQPPFFDMNADDAINYGAIGVVIGHEMTHGFDDQGRNYDKDGNLNNWWTETDSKNFTERTKVLVDYFNAIEVLPGLFANGEFTLGENIADNGGVNISYLAFQKAKEQGSIQEVMDGFTADERFFMAYALVWAGNIRNQEIERLTKEDVHSLGRWRVNATLPHINAFVDTYKVQPGDGMYLAPEKRANIW